MDWAIPVFLGAGTLSAILSAYLTRRGKRAWIRAGRPPLPPGLRGSWVPFL